MPHRLISCFMLLVFPVTVFATDTPVSRRDGFLLIWEGIRRPVVETTEKNYTDVPVGSVGEVEITYGKHRGFLPDEDSFSPDAPLRLPDAILWMLRTRNVDDQKLLAPESAPSYALKYGLVTRAEVKAGGIPNRTLTEKDLSDLLVTFEAAMKNEVHEVSLYGEDFQGKGTAFGEKFDMNDLTAAHRTLPYNTLLKVMNISNGKSVIVRINDRGPFVKGRDLDLSVAAFTTIEDRSKGKLLARFERLGDVTLVGPCAKRDVLQQRVAPGTVLSPGIPKTLSLGASLTLKSSVPFVVLNEEYPGGDSSFVQNWILKGETYSFMPSEKGSYRFLIAAKEGKQKWFSMEVASCE